MEAVSNLSSFVIAGILLNLTPGQDTMYILGRSIAQGRQAGILSVLGVSTGAVIHTLAASLGLSAILMTSAIAFSIVKYLGAAYLVYLGVRMFIGNKRKDGTNPNSKTAELKYAAVYRQGILTNLLNPKVAIFFMAFLPQFINPEYARGFWPFLFLGSIFITTGTIWCLVIVFFSSFATRTLKEKAIVKKMMDRISGGIFFLLGVKLAFEKN